MGEYFPISYRIDDKKILLIGAGSISNFKFQKIIDYHPELVRVIALDFKDSFLKVERDGIEYIQKHFEVQDVVGFDMVIVAIEDVQLQRSIYQLCNSQKIFCNCVDLIDCCDFIFPSLVKRGDISVAINSNGLLPGFSAVMRTYIDKLLPQNIEKEFYALVELRKSLTPGKERMQLIRQKAQNYFDSLTRED